MKIAGDYLFEGPQDVVWEALMDPDVLCSVLPGCDKLERVGEDEYEGALEIKIGPVQGAFKGKVKLSDIVKPDSYTMRVDGQGPSGFVNATGHLELRPENGQTHVDYEGDAQVGGRLAAVGQRLVESSAKAIIKQSLDGLNEAVKSRVGGAGAAGGAGDADAPGGGGTFDATGSDPGSDRPVARAAPKRPSQAEFATNVAREVAADMIPAPVRWGLGIAALVAILYFIYAVLV
ncbi:MAG TPA: carbon monoxide dehydrogenase subunit G [Gemmatimonadota bacterium]|nr:carbon monoxide dehydrogenase subunit G [Gemmatimonadota bacterium]